MQQISNLQVFSGTIPNKATQTDNEFANNIFGFLNYNGSYFVSGMNIIVDEINILSDEIETAASQTAQHATVAQNAYSQAQTAIALLNAGVIDNTTIAPNKTYSNQYINSLFSNREDKLGSSIASASSVTIGTAGLGDTIHITGTTNITSFGMATVIGTRRTLIFDSALTLTHNGTFLICPNNENIVTTPGTVIEVVADNLTVWRVLCVSHPSLSFTKLGYLSTITSDLQAQLNGLNNTKAPLSSPALTGTPTAPTPNASDNSTKIATTAYVDGKMVRRAAVNSTSGTSIDFTAIPSWAKRITVMFNGVSTNGTALKQIQLGTSAGVETTGYQSGAFHTSSYTSAYSSSTTGLVQSVSVNSTAAETMYGSVVLTLLDNNTWVSQGANHNPNYSIGSCTAGAKTLAGVLDRIRITTTNGTDTFDAGNINILYEG